MVSKDQPMRKYLLLAIGLAALAILAVVFRRSVKIAYRNWTREISTGRFQDPEGLALDAAGNIYVADEDWQRFTVLDPQGKTVVTFQEVEGYTVNGKVVPITTGDSLVALGTGHLVIIAQYNLAELKIQDGKVSLVRAYGEFGDPEGIAQDKETGDLYVTDEDNHRIQIFDVSGTPKSSWPVPQDPESICVDKDRVYVTFSKNDWVGCYDKAGKMLFRFGEKGRGPGQLRNPDFVCVGPDGLLYITDQKNDRIQVFDRQGHYRRIIGGTGTKPGKFRDPEDLAFDAAGNLIVADGGNHRVQVLTREGKPLHVFE
jgi:DNA-binding beta-propeller fold protein YncE